MLVADWEAEPVEECVAVEAPLAVASDNVEKEPADSREGIALWRHSS